MRCQFHQPSSRLLEALEEEEGAIVDPDSSTPLVETRLEESEMNFGYVEEGVKKSALVKVVLCRECGKKLRRGKEKAKEPREKGAIERGEGNHRAQEEPSEIARVESETERREGRKGGEREEPRKRRYSKDPVQEEEDGEEYAPALPPDIKYRRHASPTSERRRSHSQSRSRRRSASPSRR